MAKGQITARVKQMALEPSTWRGVGALVVAFGLASASTVNAVVAAGVAIAGAVEVIRKEAK